MLFDIRPAFHHIEDGQFLMIHLLRLIKNFDNQRNTKIVSSWATWKFVNSDVIQYIEMK